MMYYCVDTAGYVLTALQTGHWSMLGLATLPSSCCTVPGGYLVQSGPQSRYDSIYTAIV